MTPGLGSALLIFVISVILCNDLLAQQYPFVHYTPKDGLVNSRVRSIKQDSKGRMYFITYGGLSVYDGTRFINYRQDNGLANELVNDIAEVGSDSFLIATNTAVLNSLIRGKLGIYKTADNFSPLINRFLKSNDGKWYATGDDGLFLLQGNRFLSLPFIDSKGNDIRTHLDKIVEWKNFFLIIPWSDEYRKLILYDKTKHKIEDVYFKERLNNVAVDATGRIWISTSVGIRMIDTLSLGKGVINFQKPPPEYKNATNRGTAFVYVDAENNTWFYSRDEVQRISPQLQEQLISPREGLKTGNLSDLFRDREGIVWMASDGNGVIKMSNPNIQILNNFSGDPPDIISGMQCHNDTIWLFNSKNRSVYRIFKKEIRSFPLGDEKMKSGNIYIINQELCLMNDRRIISVRNKNNANAYKKPDVIIAESTPNMQYGTGITDPHGAIIQHIKTNDGLFYLYVIKDGKLLMKYQLSYVTDQLALDKQGRIWAATRNNHIYVFSLHPEKPSDYLSLLKEYSKELPEMSIRSMTIDNNNSVWIGTRYTGVYRLEFKGLDMVSYKHFTTKNGLTDNFIFHLSCDNNNTIWVGTQTGLDKIFRKDDRYIIGNMSKSNNFFQSVIKIVTTKDNSVWALTNEGSILKVTSASPSMLPVPPPLLLTSLLVNNQLYNDTIANFSYHQNNLLFNVAAPSFTDEKSIRYSFLLDGSGNSTWSEPSNNAIFNVMNLAPGKYALKVKSEFPEAMYPAQTLTYSFVIKPPYWQIWWFRSGVGLLVIGLLIIAIRFYYRRKLEKRIMLLEKQQAVEKERTRIATDMHDDLGGGLSRIKFLSQSIQLKTNEQKSIADDVSKIAQYSDEMVDKMGEIVWALNEKNDSLADLLAFTRAYAVEYLSSNNIACDFRMPDAVPEIFISGETRRNIFLSVKEALHNIIKHAAATEVILQIEFDKNLKLIIHDNGKGIDFDHIRRFGNGLSNIQERIKSIGGKATIKNDKGALIQLEVPV